MNYILKKTSQFGLSFILLLLFLFCFQPAFAIKTTPTTDFIDNGDGTVTHKTTGLVWMRCSMGQTWDKATSSCTGNAQYYNWYDATVLKITFAGKSDWRLPNIAELQTIIERENVNPSINITVFPNTPNYYDSWWSSSPDATHSYYDSLAWLVNSGAGSSGRGRKFEKVTVRLVRGGQLSFDFLPLTTPASDFIDNQNGTVTHKRTGLTWQRCSVGQTWTGTTCSGTTITYTWSEAMVLTSNFVGNSDWRVPTQNELLSIAEYGAYNPAINAMMFPNTSANEFWSSSLNTVDINKAFYVHFAYGSVYGDSDGRFKSDSYAVRLVRGQWTAPPASNLDMTNATCRYVAPFYSAMWQQMKTKNAPSCSAVLRYLTWIKQTRKENIIASNYYSDRLANIDTSNQLFAARLELIDDGLSILSDVLDPDLRKVLSPEGYKSTVNIFKKKGIVKSLLAGKTPFKSNLKGRILNKAFKDKVIVDGGSNVLCNLFLDGAVAESCINETRKIVKCADELLFSKTLVDQWKGAAGCVMGGVTSYTGLINNIFDIGQVVGIKQHKYGYVLINDYLNDYYAKGTVIIPTDDVKLEADIQKYANQLSLSSGGLFTFADFDMQFVKDGIRDSINRDFNEGNANLKSAKQLWAILNK